MTISSSKTPLPAQPAAASTIAPPSKRVTLPPKPQTLAENVAPSGERFRADMPAIPGVHGSVEQQQAQLRTNWTRGAVALGALLILGSAGAWLMMRATHHESSAAAPVLQPTPEPVDLPAASSSRTASTNEIGTVEQFAIAWTAKKFSYTRPLTREQVPAIAVRLPVGNGQTAASYWVILLKTPYGQCTLEYVEDPKQVASRFGYATNHPMLADPCSNSLYDPTRMGTLPNGSWARGEIVHGSGFRPPMQIEIRIEGGKLFAGRAED